LKTSRSVALHTMQQPAQQLSLWDGADNAGAWQVRQSRRARRLAARVFRDGSVEIVVPLRTSPTTVSAFVARYRQWIERQQARMQPNKPESFPPQRISFAAVGQLWECEVTPRLRPGRVRVACEPLQERPGVLQLGDGPEVRPLQLRALRRWLIERARLELASPLRRWRPRWDDAGAAQGSAPADAVGQLYCWWGCQPELLCAISAAAGAALPAGARAGPPATYESFSRVLGSR